MGQWFVFDQGFYKNPTEIVAVMKRKEKESNKNKVLKMPRDCYDNNHSTKYQAGVEVLEFR